MEICFTTPKNFNPFSWLIREIENRDYSHVVLKWHSDSLDRELVYQSNIHGMLFIGGKKFDSKNNIVKSYTMNFEEFQDRRVMQWCIDVSGGSYDIGAIFKSLCNKTLNLFGIKSIQFKTNGHRTTICSELVANAIYPFFSLHINPDSIELMTPSDLDKLLSELSKKYPNIVIRNK